MGWLRAVLPAGTAAQVGDPQVPGEVLQEIPGKRIRASKCADWVCPLSTLMVQAQRLRARDECWAGAARGT